MYHTIDCIESYILEINFDQFIEKNRINLEPFQLLFFCNPFADANERTIYGCVVFTMPFEMRAVSVQSVWGDGETEDHNDPPIWLHHQNM